MDKLNNICREARAWATTTWDNQFWESDRTPFKVPETVPWCDLREMLMAKFFLTTGCTRGLSYDNLKFLEKKAFIVDEDYGPNDDCSNRLMQYKEFCQDKLRGRKFSFWEWFYANTRLIGDHLTKLWNGGYIVGFVNRKQTREMLVTCTPGTFLITFSASVLGGVTINWIDGNSKKMNFFFFS